MTLQQAHTYVEELRGRFDAPFSLSDKELIVRLTAEVLGKVFRPTTCQQCYHDQLIVIYTHLKRYNTMAEKKQYRLRAGAFIQCPTFHDGKVFTNATLTDEIAAEYLQAFPNRKNLFQQIPTETAKVEEPAADTETPQPKRAKKTTKRAKK